MKIIIIIKIKCNNFTKNYIKKVKNKNIKVK